MTSQLLLRALHFIGVILWMGGVVTTVLVASIAASSKQTIQAVRQVGLKIVSPAMIMAWVGGLGMLIPTFTTYYAKQGWMHGKLTLVLIASGLSGMISATLRKAETSENNASTAARLRGLSLAMVIIMILVVSLAVLKPGGG